MARGFGDAPRRHAAKRRAAAATGIPGLLNEGGDLRTGGTASAGSDRPSRFDRIGVEQHRARGGDLLGLHVSAHHDA
jgi:hypothetical protein